MRVVVFASVQCFAWPTYQVLTFRASGALFTHGAGKLLVAVELPW